MKKPFDDRYAPNFPGNAIDNHELNIKQEADEAIAERQYNQMVQAQQEQQDPFAMSRYSGMKMPDTPINFGGSMADSLLNDDEVPEETRKKYWYIFHKDNTLTFLDKDRKISKMISYDISRIDLLNTTPYYDYNFNLELEMNVLRNVFETKLDRALGTMGQNIKNERTVLQSQFTENRSVNENTQMEVSKTGFFKRLLGRR